MSMADHMDKEPVDLRVAEHSSSDTPQVDADLHWYDLPLPVTAECNIGDHTSLDHGDGILTPL